MLNDAAYLTVVTNFGGSTSFAIFMTVQRFDMHVCFSDLRQRVAHA